MPPESASAIRLRRLLYRSKYTGTLETDRLLGGFAAAFLHRLAPAQLDRYEALLDNSDPDLFLWISGRLPVPPAWDNDVMAMLKALRLPDLET